MGQGSKAIFNTISLIFLLLTLVVCLCTVGVLADAIAVPDSLVPATDVPLPTLGVKGTLPPTASPTATNTGTPLPPPTWTPSP